MAAKRFSGENEKNEYLMSLAREMDRCRADAEACSEKIRQAEETGEKTFNAAFWHLLKLVGILVLYILAGMALNRLMDGILSLLGRGTVPAFLGFVLLVPAVIWLYRKEARFFDKKREEFRQASEEKEKASEEKAMLERIRARIRGEMREVIPDLKESEMTEAAMRQILREKKAEASEERQP